MASSDREAERERVVLVDQRDLDLVGYVLALPWYVLTTTGSPTRTGIVALAEMTPTSAQPNALPFEPRRS
jgi:hypothetical protein